MTLYNQWYLSIYNAMEELNKRGIILSYHYKDLEDRLIIAYKDLGR
jgi:predicted HTH domain antitoxin